MLVNDVKFKGTEALGRQVHVGPGAEISGRLKFRTEFCPALPIKSDLDFVSRKPADRVRAETLDLIQNPDKDAKPQFF